MIAAIIALSIIFMLFAWSMCYVSSEADRQSERAFEQMLEKRRDERERTDPESKSPPTIHE